MQKRVKNFLKDNRGLSEVVTTLIMVLLVIVALMIVWGVVANLLNSKKGDIESTNIFLSTEVLSVTAGTNPNTVNIVAKRNPGEGSVTGVKFLLSDGTNTFTTPVKSAIGEFETKTYTDVEKGSLGAIKSATLIPVIGTSSGDKNSKTTSTKTLTYDETIGTINSDLIAWWKFEGDAKDSSGNTLDGSCTVGSTCPSYVSGIKGQAANFDGVNDALNVPITRPNFNKLSIPDDVTILMWLNINSISTGYSTYLIDKGTTYWGTFGNSNYELYFFQSLGGSSKQKVRMYSYTTLPAPAYGIDTSAPSDVIPLNSWQHIGWSFDKDTGGGLLYVNGAPKPPKSANGRTLNTNNLPLYIGSNLPLDGQLDEVMIFNRALTPAEIKSIYEASK
ncbi:hypothetical protein COU57_05730 [Candidatus Pacearchaeota archaeon CG10_big_fil_rev_8_21_14_0_10_32_14]|nr:MAG: hypothetical protein COU57_05730 [Candidatus Pacearchaeota archaeon CG10_big_fil_rev_8_21_14_0_10_32_14]